MTLSPEKQDELITWENAIFKLPKKKIITSDFFIDKEVGKQLKASLLIKMFSP
jgi:hypothetical protein